MDSSNLEALDSAHQPGPFATAASAARLPVRHAGVSVSSPAGRSPSSSSRREDRVRELALGCSLGLLRDGEVHLALGYVRLEHYLLDRLGMSQRTAQELMRTSAALGSLPAVTAAFLAGEITSAHARLVTRVATPKDEAMWVARARKRGVRQLARDVAVAAREGAACPDGSSGSDRAGTALASRMIDPDPLLQRLSMRAPAWISSMWRDVKVRVRRLAGSMLPAGACLEALLAEASAGGWQPPESDEVELHASACEGNAGAEADDGRGSVEAAASAENPPSGPMDLSSFGGKARSEDPLFPRELDAELRRLVCERQLDEARLAGELAECRRWRSHLLAGYESLEAFALERHGLAPRRLYYLLALHRDLHRLPGLRLAFLGGRVTLREALLVAKVATAGTAEPWIRRAESVSFRRLGDEVDFWTHLRDTRYEVWRLLNGRPLPEGIALEPGKEPRLHVSASGGGAAKEAGEADASGSGGDLHVSARAEHGMRAFDGTESVLGSPPGGPGSTEFVTAATLLAALQADQRRVPLPERITGIDMLVEPDVMDLWNAKLAELRASIRPDLLEWEAFALLMHHFVTTWDTKQTRRQVRENPILERGGWRCAVPGCRNLGTGNLQVHHVTFRSHGGAVGDPSNEIPVCSAHHLISIHRGIVRVTGRAPDGLRWEMGLVPGRPDLGAFQVFESGDVLVR